jgi:hypothetical protein
MALLFLPGHSGGTAKSVVKRFTSWEVRAVGIVGWHG